MASDRPSGKAPMPQRRRSTSFKPGQSGNPDGRPEHVPSEVTRRAVEAMAAVGTPQDDIAAALQLSRRTLTKYYRHELDTAAIRANAQVGQTLFQMAVGNPKAGILPHFGAAKWWTQTRMGWKASVEITSEDLRMAVAVAARFNAQRPGILEAGGIDDDDGGDDE